MNRKGSIYFLTLSSAVLLMTMVLGLSVMIMKQRRVARVAAHVDEATICAELGIRHALYFTKEVPNWRSLLTSGSWLDSIPNGPAIYNVTGIDTVDGNLQNSSSDPVQLTCTATVGNVQRTLRLQTEQPPSILLNYAVAAGGNINIAGTGKIIGNATSNGNIVKTVLNTFIVGDAEAARTVPTTSGITGAVLQNGEAKSFPDPQSIIDYYIARATAIGYTDHMDGVLLSPTSNPFGPVNADGLYVIDCANQPFLIKNCRIVGTLILKKAISNDFNSKVEQGVNWRPARPDYPALIIDGGSYNIFADRDLQELNEGVDMSLPGEPGFGNVGEIYPNEIKGTIYCVGNLNVGEVSVIKGSTIVTGSITISDNASAIYDTVVVDNPQMQFRDSYLAPVVNSWQEVMLVN